MTVGLGFQAAVLGFAAEETFGTKVTPTKFIELLSGNVTKSIEPIVSGAIPGIYTDDDEFAQGVVKVEGSFEFEFRYEGMELLLQHAMGAVSTVEIASFVVYDSGSNQNNKIDFNIGAGELTATIAAGTYAVGQTDADTGTLCAIIKAALSAADATGTYTVSFSRTTKKVTFARSEGTFSISWIGGTNASDGMGTLLGCTADDTGALSYVSDAAIVPVFTHTFALADALPAGMTFELDEDISAATIEGGKINSLELSLEVGGYLKGTLGIVGEDKTYGAATAQTLPIASLVNFTQGAVTYGGTAKNIKAMSLSLNNSLKTDRYFIGGTNIKEPTRGGKVEITGSVTIDFESIDEYNDYVAGTAKAIVITLTGAVIKGVLARSITITLPAVRLTASVPNISDEGPMELEMPFKAYAQSSATREFSVAIQNTLSAVA